MANSHWLALENYIINKEAPLHAVNNSVNHAIYKPRSYTKTKRVGRPRKIVDLPKVINL